MCERIRLKYSFEFGHKMHLWVGLKQLGNIPDYNFSCMLAVWPTMFGKILKVFGQFLESLFSFGQNFVPTLAKKLGTRQIFIILHAKRLKKSLAVWSHRLLGITSWNTYALSVYLMPPKRAKLLPESNPPTTRWEPTVLRLYQHHRNTINWHLGLCPIDF